MYLVDTPARNISVVIKCSAAGNCGSSMHLDRLNVGKGGPPSSNLAASLPLCSLASDEAARAVVAIKVLQPFPL